MVRAELAAILDLGEAEALADVVRAAPEAYAAVCGASVAICDGVSSVIAPDGGGLWLNHVIGLGLQEPASEALVDALIQRHRRAGVPFLFKINPFAQPGALTAWLEERGFRRTGMQCKLSRDLTLPAPVIETNLRVERVGPEFAQAFAGIVVEAFGMSSRLQPLIAGTVGRPGWVHIMAFDGEEPVATGAVFNYWETGWIGMDATLASHRRRGAQGAIMAARIRAATEAGLRWLTTDTRPDLPENPNPSYHNMVRTGFSLAYERGYYVLAP